MLSLNDNITMGAPQRLGAPIEWRNINCKLKMKL